MRHRFPTLSRIARWAAPSAIASVFIEPQLMIFVDLAAYWFAGYVGYWSLLRRNGYNSPIAGITFIFVYTVAWIAMWGAGRRLVTIPGAPEQAFEWAGLLASLSGSAIMCAAMRFGWRALPSRRRHKQGWNPPKFPWMGMARVWYTATVFAGFPAAVSIFSLTSGSQFRLRMMAAALPLAVLAALGSACESIAKRSKSSAPGLVEHVDSRRPVVYLRDFGTERDLFFNGSSVELQLQSKLAKGHLSRTLEGYLQRDIEARLGPVVAFGNPTDYVPAEGVRRRYLAEDEWQQTFAEFIQGAQLILIQGGVSSGLNWELNTLRSFGLQTRVALILPPSRGAGLMCELRELLALLRSDAIGKRPPSWEQLSIYFRDCGYLLPKEAPNAGAVIGFDSNSNGVILCESARSPGSYVDTFVTHVASDANRTPAAMRPSEPSPTRLRRDRWIGIVGRNLSFLVVALVTVVTVAMTIGPMWAAIIILILPVIWAYVIVAALRRRFASCPYCASTLPNDTLSSDYLTRSAEPKFIRCGVCYHYSRLLGDILTPDMDASFDAALPFHTPAFLGGIWPPTCVACGKAACRHDSIDRQSFSVPALLFLYIQKQRASLAGIPYCELHSQAVDIYIHDRLVWVRWGSMSALRGYISTNAGKPQLSI